METANNALMEAVRDHGKPEVGLVGQDGNAFNIMGLVRKATTKQGWSKDAATALLNEMMSGDYDHLLATAATYCEVY